MHYTEHPDYQLYKDKIDQLLKDGFPKKSYSRNFLVNHFIEQPLIKPKGQLSPIEQEFKDFIGQKKGLLTVIGFFSDGTLSPKLNPIVCQCDCGAYCIIKLSNFQKENIILSCSECGLTQHGFSEHFWSLHGVNLDDRIVCSIFGGQNLKLETFAVNASKQLGSHNPLEGLSIDALKILTNQYNAYSIEFFALSEDKKHLLNPKIFEGGIRKELVNCYVQRPELLNLNDVPTQLHNRNISQMVGVRLDRFDIVGILKTDDIYTDYSTNKANLVARCDCGIYAIFNFKKLNKPDKDKFYRCSRCQFIENEVIRREYELNGVLITSHKAWEILGYKPLNVKKKITPLNSDVSNSYSFEINRFDKEQVPEYQKKFFGHRFGFIVIEDKARRVVSTIKRKAFAIATCDCGQECYFPYRKLNLNSDNPVILACSKCSHEINTTFYSGNESLAIIGHSTTTFQKRWKHYLHLFNYDEDTEFSPIWRAYLLMKKKNSELSFKEIVNKLIEASIRFKENQLANDKNQVS